MTKIIVSLLSLSLIWFNLPGCAARYGTYDPESKYALRTLAGGAVGALVAGNTGGAIVGAFVADVYSLSTVKYEDRQIRNGEEAAKEYKEQDKKVEKKKEEKKVEKRKVEEKKVRLFIEGSFVATKTVSPGSTVEANIQYTLLASEDSQQIKITETRILSSAEKTVEVDKREVVRMQGTYVSTIKFKLPDDMPRGYCILYTTIYIERYAKSAKAVINVI